MKLLVVAALVALAAAGTVYSVSSHSSWGSRLSTPTDGWFISTGLPNGATERFGKWETREECEANIKQTESQQHSYGSECIKGK